MRTSPRSVLSSQSIFPNIIILERAASALLEHADHVSSRVAESGSDLGRIRAHRLHDFPSIGHDGVNGRGHAVHHDVNHEPGIALRRSSFDPGAAHLVHSVIKSDADGAPCPDVPAEYPLSENG